jgi:hypothetical protein
VPTRVELEMPLVSHGLSIYMDRTLTPAKNMQGEQCRSELTCLLYAQGNPEAGMCGTANRAVLNAVTRSSRALGDQDGVIHTCSLVRRREACERD